MQAVRMLPAATTARAPLGAHCGHRTVTTRAAAPRAVVSGSSNGIPSSSTTDPRQVPRSVVAAAAAAAGATGAVGAGMTHRAAPQLAPRRTLRAPPQRGDLQVRAFGVEEGFVGAAPVWHQAFAMG